MRGKFFAPLVALLLVIAWGCAPPDQPLVDSQPSTATNAGAPAVNAEGSQPTSSWLGNLDSQTDLDDNPLRRNFLIVMDASGSMGEGACRGGGRKLEVAKQALHDFSDAVPLGDNLGLYVFPENRRRPGTPLGNDPGSREQFNRAVDAVFDDGGTPLKTAMRAGFKILQEQGRRQLGYGEYHLVVLTDGEANAGEDPGRVVDEILRISPITIHTIGFCIGGGHSLNQPGRILYKEAGNRAELQEGLGSVLAEAEEFDIDFADFN